MVLKFTDMYYADTLLKINYERSKLSGNFSK